MSRKSEREARERASEILEAAHQSGEDVGGAYGAGYMTKAQRKSQARHIPFTPAPQGAGRKAWRALTGF